MYEDIAIKPLNRNRHREACGVPGKNPFLFGRPSALSEYKGSECVQQYVRECGARNPEALSSRKIQKHCATMLQLINLDEEEAVHILGPDHQIQDLRRHWCTQVDDDDDDDDDEEKDSDAESSQTDTGQRAATDCRTELSHQLDCGATTSTGRTVSPKSVSSDNRGSQHKGKQKWADVEVRAVERHMMLFIRGHKVPQKDDCIQCLEAEPSALRTRSWRGVKDYVRNRITALKRQIGSSSAQQL